jgi:hypothetical protein
MSVARLPQLGSKPVSLTVKMKLPKETDSNPLAKGLQDLYRMGEFTDVVLLCSEQRFLAHRVVLASQSRCFKDGLAAQPLPGPNMRHEIRLDVANPEAVKIMLDFLYMLDDNDSAMFNPRTQEINRDVLMLAKQFELPGLTQQAMFWLSKDLTTGNVVERLAICEEFGLSELSERILEQLTYNKAALSEVANSAQIMAYPKLMQAILQCAASGLPDAEPPRGRKSMSEPDSQSSKRGRTRKS